MIQHSLVRLVIKCSHPRVDKRQLDKWANEGSPAPAVWPGLANFRQFGNILKVVGGLFKPLLTIWQTFELTLANILFYWANLHSYKWPNIENLSSHLVTLPSSSSRLERLAQLLLNFLQKVDLERRNVAQRAGPSFKLFCNEVISGANVTNKL